MNSHYFQALLLFVIALVSLPFGSWLADEFSPNDVTPISLLPLEQVILMALYSDISIYHISHCTISHILHHTTSSVVLYGSCEIYSQ